MPPHAQRVFKGVIYDVYQWEQEGYDGSKHIFEKLKRADTVEVIAVTPDKKIIVTYQEQPLSPPFIALVSGRADRGETAFDTAKREMREEVGYESSDWELLSAYHPSRKIDHVIFTFIARNIKKVGEQELDGAEKIDMRLVDFDEFIKVTSSPEFWEDGVKKAVTQALEDPKKMEELRAKILK